MIIISQEVEKYYQDRSEFIHHSYLNLIKEKHMLLNVDVYVEESEDGVNYMLVGDKDDEGAFKIKLNFEEEMRQFIDNVINCFSLVINDIQYGEGSYISYEKLKTIHDSIKKCFTKYDTYEKDIAS